MIQGVIDEVSFINEAITVALVGVSNEFGSLQNGSTLISPSLTKVILNNYSSTETLKDKWLDKVVRFHGESPHNTVEIFNIHGEVVKFSTRVPKLDPIGQKKQNTIDLSPIIKLNQFISEKLKEKTGSSYDLEFYAFDNDLCIRVWSSVERSKYTDLVPTTAFTLKESSSLSRRQILKEIIVAMKEEGIKFDKNKRKEDKSGFEFIVATNSNKLSGDISTLGKKAVGVEQ